MMTPQLLRVSCGLLAALLAAVLLKFALFELVASNTPNGTPVFSLLLSSLGYVLAYGLPLAVVGAIVTEFVRIRHVTAHIALGTILTLAAAHFAVRGETLTSPVFSGGALTIMLVLLTGILTSLAYWAVAGRRAGWRGETAERAATMAAEAFRTASANAYVEHCKECLAIRAVLGVLLFVLLGWLSIEASGLRGWLMTETEVQGQTALKKAGYAWATFKVEGDRGVIKGLAPDEVDKRAAYDSVREALGSVIGFPGILAHIKNESVARMANSAVSQQLAEAARRENEAKVAIEAARIAAESAREAEAGANRKAEVQVLAAKAEIKRRLEEQADAAEAEIKRKFEEQALAAEAENKRKLAEQALAAEERPAGAPATTNPVEVAATESGAYQEARANFETTPPAGNDNSATSPALDVAPPSSSRSCTTQDLALVESSSIHFDRQTFDVGPAYNSELDILAASALACAPRPVLITGHADSNSDSLFNPALGLQRAQAARASLIARGVPAARVVADFAGKSDPANNGASIEERAMNRRTEFKFLEVAEMSRDATLEPDERATTCESDLVGIMAQSTIYFATASARISEESTGLIAKLSKAIETCGSVIVTVEGHTDKIGGASYNQILSEARANTVREALVATGVNPTRLASRGFAAIHPSDPADTAAAFALNRRIEFKVSGKFTSTNTGGP